MHAASLGGRKSVKGNPNPVLLFSNARVRGGAEEHMLQLLAGLDRRLFQPHLACSPELAEKIRHDLPEDVRLAEVRLEGLADVQGALALARAIRLWKISILHSHMFYSSLFASPVGRICQVPVIIETSHGREVWRTGRIKSKFFIDRVAGHFVDGYIAVSGATARYLIDAKRIPSRKVEVIAPALDLNHYSPDRREPAGLRRKLDFGEKDPILLVVGRLEPQKGHRILIDAMPSVLREFPTARLVCLSEGSLRTDLEDQVAKNGLNASVRFVGYQPDLRDWLALADITVLPSFYEGLPLVAIESMAAGRTIVATAVDGTPEVVLDGKTGLTVPPGDPASLARSICRLLGDPALRHAMAQAGREFVLERYSIKTLLHQTQAFYWRVWEQKNNGRSFVGTTEKSLSVGTPVYRENSRAVEESTDE